ncbi:MAG: ATP-binding protein [Flavobacteriales bacterium]|jgi:PAS domain S-box-containing protein
MEGRSYHRLLERQLKKLLPGYPAVGGEMAELLRAISNSYEHFDNDRLLMETAMRESSDELMAKKSALNALLDRQSHVLESLKEAAASLFPDQASVVNEDLLRLADIVQEEIQKRHIAETRKEQTEQRLRDIIESLDLGMARYNLQGKLSHVEPRFAQLFGKDPAEMRGMSADDFQAAPVLAEELKNAGKFEFSASHRVFEAPLIGAGEELWLLCTTAPIENDEGEAVGGVIVVFDITQRKKLEREMTDARKAAEAGLELRKSILANVSHELRTPVNAIVGMSALLSSTPLNDQQKDYLKTMRFSSESLLVLIDDLLDVSRIESGKVELESIEFDVRDNFTELTKGLSLRAEEKGLKFSWEIDAKVANRLRGDVHRLNQVLTNLMSNAIKFTTEGSVQLSIRCQSTTDTTQHIRFEVVDTGIGIAGNRQAAIFQEFTQEDSSTTRKFGGTGLGLSISKKIVELMGGELKLTSEKNSGATFFFEVALERGSDQVQEVIEFNPDLKGARILLVEDNKVNQFLANALLTSWKAQVDISEDGEDAVKRVKGGDYDLVLMDLQMPIMDGFEATSIIRNELKSSIPIIGLSANALNDERERSLQIGMDNYVSKPFKPELLYATIQSYLQRG